MEKTSVQTASLAITRVFDAPRELVWKAWTEPEYIMRWWGPEGFTSPECRIDLREGGTYIFCMRGPDNRDYWSTGVFREIKPLISMVYTDNFADKNGNVVPLSYYGMPGNEKREFLVALRFEQHKGGKTKMILKHEGFSTVDMSRQAKDSWSTSFDKMDRLLEEMQKKG